MELTLERTEKEYQVLVSCDGEYSHEFDLRDLTTHYQKPDSQENDGNDPRAYGRSVYQALFLPGSLAKNYLKDAFLTSEPVGILLVADDEELQSIGWEFAYSDADGYLVSSCHFVRGLPEERRQSVVIPDDFPLHILAVPSDPLDEYNPLKVQEEWQHLVDIVNRARGKGVVLEQVKPPTINRLREQLTGEGFRVVHFMGHGKATDNGEVQLIFEGLDGAKRAVSIQRFVKKIYPKAFLVVLNTCISAVPGDSLFNNVAAALVERRIPYAIGMRHDILDKDARIFSQSFYVELINGETVEEALRQARIELEDRGGKYAVGIPVLYTSLSGATRGFSLNEGTDPNVIAPEYHLNLDELPGIEGQFHGRRSQMKEIGGIFTNDSSKRLITIHAGVGQGKTALARVVAERFAYLFPGGTIAINLRELPTKRDFVEKLARFTDVEIPEEKEDVPEENYVNDLWKGVRKRLSGEGFLLILDNVETFSLAIKSENADEARELEQFIRYKLSFNTVTILATSQHRLDWKGEEVVPLTGLTEREGEEYLRSGLSGAWKNYSTNQLRDLCEKLSGNPLSLRLLFIQYNEIIPEDFDAFVEQYEKHLWDAEDKILEENHPHRNIENATKYTIKFIPSDWHDLLSCLWVLHGWFQPQTVIDLVSLSDRDINSFEIPMYLRKLHNFGLLREKQETFRNSRVLLYRLMPALRRYVTEMPQTIKREQLEKQFGQVQAEQLRSIIENQHKEGLSTFIAQHTLADLEQGIEHVKGKEAVIYNRQLGRLVFDIDNQKRGLELLEQTLELARDIGDQLEEIGSLISLASAYRNAGQLQKALELFQEAQSHLQDNEQKCYRASISCGIAKVHSSTGQIEQALAFFDEALELFKDDKNNVGKAKVLNGKALILNSNGQTEEALELLDQALVWYRESGDLNGEALTLNNLGLVHHCDGNLDFALVYYKEALPLIREVQNPSVEANVIENMGKLYLSQKQPREALILLKEALSILRMIDFSAAIAATRFRIAQVLFHEPKKTKEAIDHIKVAIRLFSNDLVYDTSGATVEEYKAFLERMENRRKWNQVLHEQPPLRYLPESSMNLLNMIDDEFQGDSKKKLQLLQDLASLSPILDQDEVFKSHYIALQKSLHDADTPETDGI